MCIKIKGPTVRKRWDSPARPCLGRLALVPAHGQGLAVPGTGGSQFTLVRWVTEERCVFQQFTVLIWSLSTTFIFNQTFLPCLCSLALLSITVTTGWNKRASSQSHAFVTKQTEASVRAESQLLLRDDLWSLRCLFPPNNLDALLLD